MEVAESYEHHGVPVRIYWDPYLENPRKDKYREHLGTMVCWHPSYELGDEYVDRNGPPLEELIASYKPRVVLPLYLYDHSGLTMNTTGFHCPWDSGQVGFIFVTAEKIREEYAVARITQSVEDQAKSCLQAEVEEFNSYLTGDCYGFIVDKDGPDEDSCWGFLGDLEYCKEQAEEAAEVAASLRADRDLISRMYLLDPEAQPFQKGVLA